MGGGAALLGGLATGLIQGYTGRKEEQHQRKLQLSDEEREQALADHNNTIQSLQGKIAQAKSTGDDTALSGYQNQLNQVVSDRTALFHPSQGPGALAHLGRMVFEHVHGKQQPEMEQTPTATAATNLPNIDPVNAPGLPSVPAQHPTGSALVSRAPVEATQPVNLPPMGGAGPNIPAPQGPVVSHPKATPADLKARAAQDLAYGAPAAPQNPLLVHRQQLSEAGFTPEQVDKAMGIFAGIEAKPVAEKEQSWTPYGKPVKGKDGVYEQPFRNRAGEIENRPVPEGYQPPMAKLTTYAQNRADYAKAKGYGSADEMTFEDDQNMTRLLKQAGTGATVSDQMRFVPQPDGSIKAERIQNASRKDFGGKPITPVAPTAPPGSTSPSAAAPSAALPTSPVAPTSGALKKKIAGVAAKTKAGVVQNGDIVGGRDTAPAVTAKKARDVAENSYLDVQKASQDPTPLGDQGVILAWLRGRVNRVTQPEIQAVNNLGGAKMQLEGRIAKIVSGKMTDQQRQWFLRSAKDNYDDAIKVASKYDQPGSGGAATSEEGPSVDDILKALNKGK
jgi:hypothetical protein